MKTFNLLNLGMILFIGLAASAPVFETQDEGKSVFFSPLASFWMSKDSEADNYTVTPNLIAVNGIDEPVSNGLFDWIKRLSIPTGSTGSGIKSGSNGGPKDAPLQIIGKFALLSGTIDQD